MDGGDPSDRAPRKAAVRTRYRPARSSRQSGFRARAAQEPEHGNKSLGQALAMSSGGGHPSCNSFLPTRGRERVLDPGELRDELHMQLEDSPSPGGRGEELGWVRTNRGAGPTDAEPDHTLGLEVMSDAVRYRRYLLDSSTPIVAERSWRSVPASGTSPTG